MASSSSPNGPNSSPEVYCFCREPEGRRFMIQCDGCDEWFHGDCLEITKAASKNIDKFFCGLCISRDPAKKTTYINKKNGSQRVQKQAVTEVKDEKVDSEGDKASDSPSSSPSEASTPSTSRKAGGGGIVESGQRRIAVPGQRNRGKKKNSSRAKSGKASLKKTKDEEPETRWNYESTAEKQKHGPQWEPMQCLGPKCVNESLRDSKYCSIDCGRNLAMARLQAYGLNAVRNYFNVEPVAERLAKKVAIRRGQSLEVINEEHAALNRWHSVIVDYVKALESVSPDEENPKNKGNIMVQCTVCAFDFGHKVLMKHMEKCLAKHEKQDTFGATKKYSSPDNIVCDKLNKSDNSYCRRLRVICPEHYKEELEIGVKVCGWPKVWNREQSATMDQQFTDVKAMMADGFCRISRKECKHHAGWIKTYLGNVDSLRLACIDRKEELTNKVGEQAPDALLLMSNHTEYHQPLDMIIKSYEDGVKKAGEAVKTITL